MAKRPRKGNGSDKTLGGGSGDNKQIPDGISASDGIPGRGDEAYTPFTPKPAQPPRNGRTDMNANEAFRRAQEIANHTTPQMSKRHREKLEAMKSPAPEPSVPAPGLGMGSGASMGPSSEEDPRNANVTDEQLKVFARQYVDVENAGNEQSDYSWMNDAVGERFSDAVEFEKAVDAYRDRVNDLAAKLTLEQVNSFSVEGYTVDDGSSRLHGDKGLIVTTIAGREEKLKVDPADLQVVIAERLASEPADTPQRWATFLPLENDQRLQFTDSSMSHHKAAEQMLHLRGVLTANDEKVIADRLYVSDLTDDEIKAERSLPPQNQPRHERAFAEAAQREFSSLSNPSLSGKDHIAVADAYNNAPKVAAENMVRRDEVADRSPEGLQKHSNGMFEEGRDLRDIYSQTKVKPEGADQTAWAKTEYVYGQPTALDRLQELGKGGFAVSESGYTYAMSADGTSLLRFDIDGNPAGQKPVEDVQAFLQEKRGVEFDAMQEAKEQQQYAKEVAERDARQEHANKLYADGMSVVDIALETDMRPVGVSEESWEDAGRFVEYAQIDPEYLPGYGEDGWSDAAHNRTLENWRDRIERGTDRYDEIAESDNKFVERDQVAHDQFVSEEAEDRVENVQRHDLSEVHEELSQSNEIYPEHFGSHFVSGPIWERMGELKPEFDTKSMTTEQWGEAYASSRQELQQWNGENIEQYFDLHARTELSAVKADVDLVVRLQDREDDVYAMSPDAKDELENLGVDLDNLERAVQWRNAELGDAMEENKFVEKDDVARDQFVSEEAEDRQNAAVENEASEVSEQAKENEDKPEAYQSDEAKLVTNEHEAEDKHSVEAANEDAAYLTQKAPQVETSLDIETEASRGDERDKVVAPAPAETSAVEEVAPKAEAAPEMAPQVEPERAAEATAEVSEQSEASVDQELKSEFDTELSADVAGKTSTEVAPEITYNQDQYGASVSKAEASSEVGPAIDEQQSADVSAEIVPANQNEVAKEVISEAAEVRQDPSAKLTRQPEPGHSKADEAVLGQGQPQDSSSGAAPELSPGKTKVGEEEKTSAADLKVGIETDMQPEKATKIDSPEVAEARQIFNKINADLEAKEAKAAPSAEKQASAEAVQQPEQAKAPEPEAPAKAPEASAPQKEDSPEVAEARQIFKKGCEQQDQKEAAQAQQPQMSDEEERRRGPGMEAD